MSHGEEEQAQGLPEVRQGEVQMLNAKPKPKPPKMPKGGKKGSC